MRTASQVSVVIPTYNRAQLLRHALESVFAQTSPPGEIIVVDDGSTDGTADVVHSLRGGGIALRYVELGHTNHLGYLRDTGVQGATGSIIALLDSDDVWLPERVAKQLEHWNRHSEAGFAFCNVQRFDESGPFAGGPWLDPARDYSGRIVRDLLLEPVAVPSALMFARSVYERVGHYSSRPVDEDYEWLLEASANYTADYVPEPLVLMRAHAQSRSRAKSMLANAEYLAIVRRFSTLHLELSEAERQAARLGMANVHLKLAGQLIEACKPHRAARHAARAIRLHPTDRRAYMMLIRSILRQARQGEQAR
jgi:glycosyltransferase involved in cell wall biosynthesis